MNEVALTNPAEELQKFFEYPLAEEKYFYDEEISFFHLPNYHALITVFELIKCMEDQEKAINMHIYREDFSKMISLLAEYPDSFRHWEDEGSYGESTKKQLMKTLEGIKNSINIFPKSTSNIIPEQNIADYSLYLEELKTAVKQDNSLSPSLKQMLLEKIHELEEILFAAEIGNEERLAKAFKDVKDAINIASETSSGWETLKQSFCEKTGKLLAVLAIGGGGFFLAAQIADITGIHYSPLEQVFEVLRNASSQQSQIDPSKNTPVLEPPQPDPVNP